MIFIILVLLILVVIYFYNRMVRLNLKCSEAWSNIDTLLKRRYDLLPNLVNVVKGYSSHEAKTLEECIDARSTSVSQTGKNSAKISDSLNKIFALEERYPDLKANSEYKNLQIDLVDTEDKISKSRVIYNECVRKYNIAIEQVPTNIVANIMNYKKRQFFNIKDEERENIKVEL